MDPLTDVVTKYADRAFSYAVCVYLLYMQNSVLKELKTAMVGFTEVVKEFGTLLRERLK